MNKLSHDKIANHFYNLGVQAALGNTDMQKTAYAPAVISRLAPMGARNFLAGAGHVGGGSVLGGVLGSHLGPDAAVALSVLGGLGGKLIKDQNTLRIAENLGALERKAVAKALGDSAAGRVGGGLSSLATSGIVGGISEALTNKGVRRRVGLG